MLASSLLTAQTIALNKITDLDPAMSESSGLVYVNGELFTHNDSGGEPVLYSIDSQTGAVIREVFIQNATNVDWEDLAVDDNFIYIGDIGNNNGDRKDLRVYKVALADIAQSDTVTSQFIEFGYSDQVDFTPNPLNNYDAEGMIELMGTLYIFTKNRADFGCNVYALPNVLDSFAIQRIGSIASIGLITGATRNSTNDEMVLLGLDFQGTFALHYQGALLPPFGNTFTRLNFSTVDAVQMEGVCFEGNQLWVSTESRDGRPAALYNPSQGISISENLESNLSLYPNPTNGVLFGIPQNDFADGEILILDVAGVTIKSLPWNESSSIDISEIPSGSYIVMGQNEAGVQWVDRVIRR